MFRIYRSFATISLGDEKTLTCSIKERLLPSSSASTRKRLQILIAASSILGLLLISFYLSRPYVIFALKGPSQSNPCVVDVSVLKQFGLTDTVHYVRREILTREIPSITSPMAHIEVPLLDPGGFDIFNISQTSTIDLMTVGSCSDPIRVEVPVPPPPADASHIDFGIATSSDRLLDALDAFAHWAGGSGGRIFAIIEPGGDLASVKRKASALRISLTTVESDEEYNVRYFALVKLLADSAREQTEWSCIMDDDTFFPSMPRLVEMLGRYDQEQPFYIGGLSESEAQISLFGIMAYGGAGIFLSQPLLRQLRDVFDQCQAMEGFGDGKIAQCIYQHTTTKLTIETSLHQLDLHDDASGFFESGRPVPVSLHHWRSWFDADMVKISAVSRVCGPSCMFRQWRFSDSWVLTNGYSVIQSSQPRTDNDLSVEKTWSDVNGATDRSYLFALGPLRPKDDKKVSYRLEGVSVENAGDNDDQYNLNGNNNNESGYFTDNGLGPVVRQYYIRRTSKDFVEGTSGNDSNMNVDSVMELVWRREERNSTQTETEIEIETETQAEELAATRRWWWRRRKRYTYMT